MKEHWSWVRAAGLVWIFVVVATYYVVHKPFAVSNLVALGLAAAAACAARLAWGGTGLLRCALRLLAVGRGPLGSPAPDSPALSRLRAPGVAGGRGGIGAAPSSP